MATVTIRVTMMPVESLIEVLGTRTFFKRSNSLDKGVSPPWVEVSSFEASYTASALSLLHLDSIVEEQEGADLLNPPSRILVSRNPLKIVPPRYLQGSTPDLVDG